MGSRRFAVLAAVAGLVAAAAPVSAQSADPVTISLWHHFTPDVEKQAMQDLADRFTELNPNVTFEITVIGASDMPTKTQTAMQSNEPPDIFSGWGGQSLGNYIEAGLVQELTDAMAVDGWKEQFLAGPLALYSFGDQVYGVPIRAGAWGLWVDTELQAQAGVEGCPATWTDLLADVDALKAAGITPIAIGARDQWPTQGWWQYLTIRLADRDAIESAATLSDRTGSFTDEPFVRANELMLELAAREPFQPGYQGASYDDQLSLAANGGAAMTADGWWGSTYISSAGADPDATKARLLYCPFPAVEEGAGDPSDVFGTGNGLSVGRDAPPEAVEFLRFMTSPDVYAELVASGFTAPPVMAGATELVEDPGIVAVIETGAAASHFNAEWAQEFGPPASFAIWEQGAALLAGATTAEAAAQAIEDSVQQTAGQ